MSVLVPNNPRVRRAPRLAFLPSPRRSLRAVMALRGQITTPGTFFSLAYNLDYTNRQISFAWPHARPPGHPDWRSWPP